MLAATASALTALTVSAAAAELPPAPPVGACTDCIGEVDSTLNVCALDRQSCVSTQNEDEDHFVAPWQYSLTANRAAAIRQLISVATGMKMCGQFGTERTASALGPNLDVPSWQRMKWCMHCVMWVDITFTSNV